MQPQESACSQALRLPEILQNIFQNLQGVSHHEHCNSPTYSRCVPLHNCILVCRLWEIEANKVLWEQCGVYVEFLPHPTLSHLARIHSVRRQRYAGLIRMLHINGEGAHDYEIRPLTPDTDAANDHLDKFTLFGPALSEVSELSFTRLEELVIHCPFNGDEAIVEPSQALPMSQFFQPRLRKLQLVVSNGNPFIISENTLQYLEQNTPMLEDIEVWQGATHSKLENRFKMSSGRVAAFLTSFQSTLIRVRWLLEQTLSGSVWKVLSTSPNLKILVLPFLEDSWLESDTRPDSQFQSLEEFKATLSGRALSRVISSFGNIKRLSLRETTPLPELWNTIVLAPFGSLTDISLKLHEDTILDGASILKLARCNSQLRQLLIESLTDSRDAGFAMTATNFTDATVTEIANALPELQDLSLQCYDRNTGLLGNETLLSLANHCPLLRSIYIFADVDWRKIFETSAEWQNLERIGLLVPDNERGDFMLYSDQDDDADELANGIIGRMPRMNADGVPTSFFDQGHTGYATQALWDILYAADDYSAE